MVYKKHSRPLSLILLITFLIPAGVWAKDSIDWMEAVAPPFFNHEGKFKGQGYERWLDPSSLEGYRKLYKDVFLTITE